MRQLLATFRHRPAPLIGTFVALTVAAVLVTMTTMFLGTALTLSVPAQRLVGAAVAVTGNPNVTIHSIPSGQNAETDVLPLPDYRRVPVGLARRLAAVRGVQSAIPTSRCRSWLSCPTGGSRRAVLPTQSKGTHGRVPHSLPSI